MNTTTRLAGAAFVAVFAVGGLIYLIGPRSGAGSPTPSPAASPAQGGTTTPAPNPTSVLKPSPASTAAVVRPSLTDFTKPFTSPQYGYSTQYPDGWTIRPATIRLVDKTPFLAESRAADAISSGEMAFLVVAQPVAPGTTTESWSKQIDDQLATFFGFSAGCPRTTTTLRVGGELATEVAFDDCPVATFMWVTLVHGGVGYQIAWTDYAHTPLADAQRVFDGFLLTMAFAR